MSKPEVVCELFMRVSPGPPHERPTRRSEGRDVWCISVFAVLTSSPELYRSTCHAAPD